MSHDAAHETLLRDVLCGELDRESPEVRERLRSCDTCRSELDALLGAAARVEVAGGARRERDLAEARAAASPLRRTAADAARRAAGGRPARGLRRTGWALLAVAGAAVVVLALRLALDGGSGGPSGNGGADPLVLGAEGLELVSPVGEVASYGTFRWAELAADGYYELRVWDAAADAGSTPELARYELDGTEWTPSAVEARELPARLRWEVRAFDGSGTLVERAEAVAWRR